MINPVLWVNTKVQNSFVPRVYVQTEENTQHSPFCHTFYSEIGYAVRTYSEQLQYTYNAKVIVHAYTKKKVIYIYLIKMLYGKSKSIDVADIYEHVAATLVVAE